MGNVESHNSSSSRHSDNHWHGADPKKDPSLRNPPKPKRPAPTLTLQRKGSSFLEEPVTHKLTERGEAKIYLGGGGGGGDAIGASRDTADGRECNDEIGVSTFPHSRLDEDRKIRYAVSEMQGWRSHMEDKHCLNPPLYSNRQQKKLLSDHHLFAVFDGHGGDFASQFCGENFVSTLTAQKDWQTYVKLAGGHKDGEGPKGGPKKDSVTGVRLLKSSLKAAFLALDASLMAAQRDRRTDQLVQLESIVYSLGGTVEQDVFQRGSSDHDRIMNFDRVMPGSMPANVPLERSGSTGVVVLVTPSHVLCANAGDSRAVLSRRVSKSGVLPLSFDHKPTNDVEVWRVEGDGGFVRNGRVDGDLAVSRSFGDFGYKHCVLPLSGGGECCGDPNAAVSRSDSGPSPSPSPSRAEESRVTVLPDILVHRREPTEDEFVVLACDGIWDRLTNRDCSDLVRTLIRDEDETDVGLICEEVIDEALEKDSRDNMTCCVVVFPGAEMGRCPGRSESSVSTDSSLSTGPWEGGVLRRRSDRELLWGDDSTPAKRARERMEERQRKNREALLALQKRQTVTHNKRQVHPQQGQGQGQGLRKTSSRDGSVKSRGPSSGSSVASSAGGSVRSRKNKAKGQSPARGSREARRGSKNLRFSEAGGARQ